MHFEPAWHAQGLRCIASFLEGTAEFLERESTEKLGCEELAQCRDQTSLRVHLRGLQ